MNLRIGFSYNYNWWDELDPVSLFALMRTCGMTDLEINPPSEHVGETALMASHALEAGLRVHFHAPYPPVAFPVAGYCGADRDACQAIFRPLFDLALETAVRQQNPCVINLHGASGPGDVDPLELRRATRDFLRWAVTVVGDYPVKLALEVALYSPGRVRVGQFGGEILDIVREIGHPALGLGLDMGHCGMYELQRSMPYDLSDDFMRRVVHAHVHDIDGEGRDHCPLVYGNVDYPGYLSWLARKHFDGAAILELSHERVREAGDVEDMVRASAKRMRELWGRSFVIS